jgi:SNF2 family DNA or RNA helicase
MDKRMNPAKSLYHHQPAGIAWMANTINKGGCILADDLGLGRTIETLGPSAHIVNERGRGAGDLRSHSLLSYL